MPINAVAVSAPISVDEVTLTKSGSGQVSIKNATGTANAANGVVVLDSSAKLPALDGSALTNIPSGEGHITIMPFSYSSITQGTFAFNNGTAKYLYGAFQNNSNAQNDRINYNVFLAAGTYTLTLLHIRDIPNAIATVMIDGATVGTIDQYGVQNYEMISSITNIVVATGGMKTLSFKAATRNGSATGWYMTIGAIGLYRTA